MRPLRVEVSTVAPPVEARPIVPEAGSAPKLTPFTSAIIPEMASNQVPRRMFDSFRQFEAAKPMRSFESVSSCRDEVNLRQRPDERVRPDDSGLFSRIGCSNRSDAANLADFDDFSRGNGCPERSRVVRGGSRHDHTEGQHVVRQESPKRG